MRTFLYDDKESTEAVVDDDDRVSTCGKVYREERIGGDLRKCQ